MKDRPKEALRAGRNGTPWRSFKPKEGQGRAEGIREPGLSSVLPAPSSPTMAVSRRRAKPVAGDNPVRWRKQAAGHLEGDGSRDDARLEAQAISLCERPVGSRPALSGAAFHRRTARWIWRRLAVLASQASAGVGRRYTGLLMEPDRASWSPGPRGSRGDGQACRWRRGARSVLRGEVARGASGRRPRSRRKHAGAENPGPMGRRRRGGAATDGRRQADVVEPGRFSGRSGRRRLGAECFRRAVHQPRRQMASPATRSSEPLRPRGRGGHGGKRASPGITGWQRRSWQGVL